MDAELLLWGILVGIYVGMQIAWALEPARGRLRPRIYMTKTGT
jgi:hypothetical protein